MPKMKNIDKLLEKESELMGILLGVIDEFTAKNPMSLNQITGILEGVKHFAQNDKSEEIEYKPNLN